MYDLTDLNNKIKELHGEKFSCKNSIAIQNILSNLNINLITFYRLIKPIKYGSMSTGGAEGVLKDNVNFENHAWNLVSDRHQKVIGFYLTDHRNGVLNIVTLSEENEQPLIHLLSKYNLLKAFL